MINKEEFSYNKLEVIARIYSTIENCYWLFNNLETYLTDDELQLEIEDLAIRLKEKLEIIERKLNETDTI